MRNDFSQGSVKKNILSQAVPLLLAQTVQLLYNIVDRIYIGHLPEVGSIALTGIGLSFPLITLITAFTNLVATGGTPLFSISRGEKDDKKSERIMAQSFMLLISFSVIIFLISYIFRKPILYLFGAGESSFPYADEYLKIYLFGTPFSMISSGMNSFINAQGFPKIGMMSVILGAVTNLILDPIFIYALKMGVKGAALATVISQIISAAWVLSFLFGKRTLYKIKKENLFPDTKILKKIFSLGTAGFIMQGTTFLVQIVCNNTLKLYGGDIYVGIMTVVNSIREIMGLPAGSLSGGSQPVLGYNYGAKKYERVKEGIRFTAAFGSVYTAVAWIFIFIFPKLMISLFTNNTEMISKGTEALSIYFFGFVFMALQFSGQTTFTALGYSKQAIFFSLLRKAIIVVPLTVLLPKLGFGVNGVFLAEPISNAIGGCSCFLTMWQTVYKRIGKEQKH